MDRRTTDREVYPALWALIVFAGIGYLLWKGPLGEPTISRCWIYQNLHIYCPGSGGTRALKALVHGDLFRSFCFHPVVPGTVFWVGVYLFSQTVKRIRNGKGWALRYHGGWLAVFFSVLILQWLVKNVLLLAFGTNI
jgi:hypothetical protein